MTGAGRAARRWILRLIGLALVAFVLTTQVDWPDWLRLEDGRVVRGRVTALPDGGFEVLPEAGGRREVVAEAAVAVRSGPAGDIPEVTGGSGRSAGA